MMKQLFFLTSFFCSIFTVNAQTCLSGNCRDGIGTMTWNNGTKYEGEFRNGILQGQGKMTLPNGNTYVGAFINGKSEGQGTMVLTNGNKYSGEFKEGRWEGEGTFTVINGDKYTGTFVAGQFDGQGSYTWANGEKYTGAWKLSQQHGKGIRIRHDSIISSGYWYKGTYIGTSSVDFEKKVAADNANAQVTAAKQPSGTKGTFVDSRDGHTYQTIVIGTQTWLAENFAYKASSGCWAYDNLPGNVAKYGYLYDWATAKAVCPAGWHLPTDAEWTVLADYLGGAVAGGPKICTTTGWEDSNAGTNTSGFSGLPGGTRMTDGTFMFITSIGFWWSATEFDATTAWHRDSGLYRRSPKKDCGLSVRYIKD